MNYDEKSFEEQMDEQGVTRLGDPERSQGPGALSADLYRDGPAGSNCSVLNPNSYHSECEESCWHAAGLEREMKKARRANAWEAEQDLHSMTLEQAWETTDEFLSRQPGGSTVLIIHGQGKDNTSIMRRRVRGWLRASPEVIWFAEQHYNKGATLVRLRNRRD